MLRGFISILTGKFSSLLLGLLITPLLVRMLGQGHYGDYAFVLSFISITTIITNAGIFDGTRKYIAETHDRPDWEANVFGFYLKLASGIGIIVSVGLALLAASGVVSRLLGPEFEFYLYISILLLLARQLRSVVRGGLMGLSLEHISESLNVLNKLVFGVAAIALVHFNYGVNGVLIGHITGTMMLVLMGLISLSKRIDLIKSIFTLQRNIPRKDLMSFNFMSFILILFLYSLYHVDVMLVETLAPEDQTGYYRAALVIAEFLWFAPMSLQKLLLHSVADLWNNDQRKRISELSSKLTRYNVLLTALLMMGLAALARDFIPLYYGAEFAPTVTPLLILLPGTFGFSITRPIMGIGQAKGDFRLLIAATGLAAGLNIVLNIILIPRYGMNGAAIATSISYSSMLFLHLSVCKKIGFDPISDLRLAKTTTTIAVSAPVIFGTAWLLPNPYSLIVVPPIGFILYSIVALNIGSISASEIFEITDRFPTPISRYIRLIIRKLNVTKDISVVFR
ncbi:oligosaccharide flippase family protein [Haloarcula amylolytica]|nr:polysaccharide biosynthesis C-terminal domain-containing protein [Haloarcula amylolytica]